MPLTQQDVSRIAMLLEGAAAAAYKMGRQDEREAAPERSFKFNMERKLHLQRVLNFLWKKR